MLALLAFSAYNRTDKYNTERSNWADNGKAFIKAYNKKKFGCSQPIIIIFDRSFPDTLRITHQMRHEISYRAYTDGIDGGPISVYIVEKSDYPSLRDTRLNFQRYFTDDLRKAGFKEIIRLNDSVYVSEIKLFEDANYTAGPLVKKGEATNKWTKRMFGDRYGLKYDSAYYAIGYLYYKKWIYRICRSGTDTVGLRKKVSDLRNSFDFSETRLKEPTFRPWEAVAITSAISLLLLACLLAGYWRVRRSFQSRAAKVVYLLHVLCLFVVLAVFLSLPDICFTSWMRGGLLCLLFTCLGIGILLSMFRKALLKR
jgi:hypothetical protein